MSKTRVQTRQTLASAITLCRPLLVLLSLVLAALVPALRAAPAAARRALLPEAALAPPLSQTAGGGCGLPSIAFCDTFDAPAGIGNRSGALNGTVWGVSRVSENTNPFSALSDAWYASGQQQCGSVVTVQPENDVNICNGRLVESVDDGGTAGEGADTILGMYPKQPFDFAGRTGKVVFDVNSDSQGSHAAWPAFVITDQPVPAPGGANLVTPAVSTTPRNSFGFSLAATCTPSGGGTGATVDRIWTSAGYVEQNLPFTAQGCVSSNINETTPGPLNHFELDISPSGASIYGTNAGATGPLVLLATVSTSMPLTRGLIWMEDVHYNACKFNTQCDHTFVWDNVGFDGPILARDLSFDVLDHAPTAGNPGNLGWNTTSSTRATLQTLPVANLGNAQAALLTLNYFPTSDDSINLSFNGNPAQTQPWPFPDSQTYAWRTLAIPVSLSQIKAGVNTIVISTSDSATIANIDLKLVGAGGVPTCLDPSNCSAVFSSPSPTPSPTPSPSPSATPTPTPAPTPSPSPTPTATPPPAPPTSSGATLGTTTVGGSLDGGDANDLNGSRVLMGSAAGSVSTISAYVGPVDTSSGHNLFQVAIYSDNNGTPGALLAQSGSATLQPNTWNTAPIGTSLAANTAYWLMYNTNATAASLNNLVFQAGGAGAWSGPQPFGSWPASFSRAGQSSISFSLYATLGSPSGSATTLGITSVGGTAGGGETNDMNGTRVVTGGSGGTVTSISAFIGTVDTSAGHNLFQVAIYGDSSGRPGALVAQSTSAVLTANTWNTAAISASLAPNTAYWLMYNTNASSAAYNNLVFQSGGLSAWSPNLAYGAWPGQFGTSTTAAISFSIYATLAPTSATAPKALGVIATRPGRPAALTAQAGWLGRWLQAPL